ncbi:phosphodiesterase [Roseimaritima multifibrata]|uniref:Phosphodiesterase n=1 Tax=Roseimaritima multifibrata TaxID=1930274 RepID=A0A517MEL2_9BACT|nr:metallophosphoesterase family protein [Roseimaritima multifibrata]QDS93321.1 phosphodiesterase [Roseimaritima multifibrata]
MSRRAIISDIHGNLAALEAVLADIETQQVDGIVCLGDTVGYGPEPCACIDHAMKFDFSILGNHDNSALFDPEGFNAAAEKAIFWTRSQMECGPDGPEPSRRRMEFLLELPRVVREGNLLFVHGSPRGPTTEYVFPEDANNPRKMEKLFALVPQICFQGHTHVPGVFSSDMRFVRSQDLPETGFTFSPSQKAMVNVGSVGQPRDHDPRSCYVIFDGDTVQFRRIEYDIERTVQAIENEPQLDNYLGYRLRDGH